MDISVFFKGLDEVFATRELEKIKNYFRAQLAKAEVENDLCSAVTILNEMIGFFRNTSDYPASIEASERAMVIMQTLGQENTVAFGTTLLNAATAYRAAGDSPQALFLYQKAQILYEAYLAENDPFLAALYNNLSGIYQEAEDYEKALALLKKAFAILSVCEGKANAAATVQTNMAQLLIALHRSSEAERELDLAIQSFEAVAPEKPAPHYAAALASLAGMRMMQKRTHEALYFYEKSLAHLKSAFGENADYATTCQNYAQALTEVGDTKRASQYTQKALDVLARLNNP